MVASFSNPLHQAIWTRDLKRIRRLIKIKSIDINKMDQLSGGPGPVDKISPFFLTVHVYKKDKTVAMKILKLLLSHPDIDVNVAFSLDGSFGKSTKTFSQEVSPHVLHFLIHDGDLDLIRALVKHPQIDDEEVSKGVITAITAKKMCEPSNEKLQNDIIETLLEHPKIDVNKEVESAEDGEIVRYSPLHYAIDNEQVKTVETLLSHPNILVNKTAVLVTPGEKREFTPLSFSMFRKPKTNEITKLLLMHPQTDVNRTDDNLCLPLITVPIVDERTLSCLKMLLNHSRIDVNARDKKLGGTSLMVVNMTRDLAVGNSNYPNARQFNDKAFKLLLNHPKIDLAVKDYNGQNILHHLINLTYIFQKDVFRYDVISDLLEKRPDLITPDNNGLSPVDLAKKVPDRLMRDILKRHHEQNRAKILKPFKYGNLFKTNPTNKTSDKEDNDIKSTDKTEKSEKKPLDKDKDTKSKKKPLDKDNATKSVATISRCCWNCDATSVKLYKCSGCKKAYYCGRDCADDDWPVHGGYCVKKQKRNKASSEI